MNKTTPQSRSISRAWVPQVAVFRDLCRSTAKHRSRNTATCGTRKQHYAAKLIATAFIAAGLSTLLTGCATTSASAGDAGLVKRLLVCQTRPEFKDKLVEASKELSKIPNVVDVFVGSRDSQQNPPKWFFETPQFIVILTLNSENAVEGLKSDSDYTHFLKLVRFYAADMKGEAIQEMTYSRVDYSIAQDFVEKNTAADLQRRAAAVKQLEEQRSRTK